MSNDPNGEDVQKRKRKRGFYSSLFTAGLLVGIGITRGLTKGFDNPFAYMLLGLGVLWFVMAMVKTN